MAGPGPAIQGAAGKQPLTNAALGLRLERCRDGRTWKQTLNRPPLTRLRQTQPWAGGAGGQRERTGPCGTQTAPPPTNGPRDAGRQSACPSTRPFCK